MFWMLLPITFSFFWFSFFFPDSETQPVRILRDTGAMQSLILEEMLPFSPESYTGSDVLIRGCEMGCVNVPLHRVYLESDLVTGPVTVGVCSRLPVEGVSFILGNELAGGKVFPRPIVTHQPSIELLDLSTQFSTAFPACVVTRAQSKKLKSCWPFRHCPFLSAWFWPMRGECCTWNGVKAYRIKCITRSFS